MTIMFNYAFALLWMADYGAKEGTHRYLRSPEQPEPDGEHDQSGEGTEPP